MLMELRQLSYFVKAAEHEHVTQAAEELRVAQSAISRQIHLLEEELGTALFIRQGKGIKLTPFGIQFLPYALRILRQAERIKDLAVDFRDPEQGMIRLGFPHSLGIHFVPNLLASFRTVAPSIQFELTQLRVQSLVNQIRDREIDLAIVATGRDPWSDHDLTGLHLFDEPLRLVLPSGHRLANEATISLKQVADEPFILFKQGYTLRDLVDDSFDKAGITPRVTLEAEETDSIRGFVRAGFGVSVLPPTYATYEGLKEVKIEPESPSRSIGLVWWHDDVLSAAAKRFVNFARETTSDTNL
jgi:LysR family transcriptional regulator, transcription activator of glutamate synthase operon